MRWARKGGRFAESKGNNIDLNITLRRVFSHRTNGTEEESMEWA